MPTGRKGVSYTFAFSVVVFMKMGGGGIPLCLIILMMEGGRSKSSTLFLTR